MENAHAIFSLTFTPSTADIDELGHVNNAVWVRWMQDISVSHWNAIAEPEHVAAYFWVVVRHEIDYHGNVGPDEPVIGTTWISDQPKGARFDRNIEFANAAGKTVVRAKSTWAMIDKASGRPARVTPEISRNFLQSA